MSEKVCPKNNNVFKIQQNTFNNKRALFGYINPQTKTSLTTYVAFRVAQLNRVGQSDSFTFVTHSTAEETRVRCYKREIVLGSRTVPCGCQVNMVPVEPIRDGPFRS